MLERRETKVHPDGLAESAPQERKEPWATKDRRAVWVAMEKSVPLVLKAKKEILVTWDPLAPMENQASRVNAAS